MAGMAWTRRIAACATAAATIMALTGLAGAAHAAYDPQPISLPWHPAGPVHASTQRGGVVYLGGKLDGTGGIAALDASSGSLLWMVPADGDVRALTLSDDGSTLFAGGKFLSVDGATHRNLVALNLADHTVIPTWKPSVRGPVRDLVATGNDVYVAGKITGVGGVAQRGIGAVVAATGKRDAAFDLAADNDVLGLALDGNTLILSGAFTAVDGAPRNLLASIDLSTNTLTNWQPAQLCSSCTQYWDVQTDGTNAYVASSGPGGSAGAFNLTTGAQPWGSRVRGDGDIQALWLPGDGRLYIGGHFGQQVWNSKNSQNPLPATVVASVDLATGQPEPDFTPGIYRTYPGAWTFTSTYGKLWVGGDFTGEQVNGANNHQPYLAAYPDPSVTGDTQPPTGTFVAGPSKAWATLTKVTLTQTSIHDNVTPASAIARGVAWGDGTTSTWTTGTTITHVYSTHGTFTPQVTLTDQAGNSSTPIDSSPIVVKADSSAPVVTVRLPRHLHSVAAWRTLRGKATDGGTGVAAVRVRAVERHAGSWYGYDAAAGRWVKAASKAKAFARATPFVRSTNARDHWSATLKGLHKGTLVTKIRATDHVGNQSPKVATRAILTRR